MESRPSRPIFFASLLWTLVTLVLTAGCGRSQITPTPPSGIGGEGGGTVCTCGDGTCDANCGEDQVTCPADR